MKNIMKVFSLLMIAGVLAVGCGSSNGSNGTTCSTNGVSGTMQSGSCVANAGASAAAGTCTAPYSYYSGSIAAYNGLPGCCTTSTASQQNMSNCYQICPSPYVLVNGECSL